jgi:lipid II:glycine glycyltransferase (peptidoglycan interpeptide bridge formation enzyme)
MDAESWNILAQAYAPAFGGFLQSYDWGQFQQSLGREVVRFQDNVDGKVILAQAVKLPLPMGQYYWFVPKGPLTDMHMRDVSRVLKEHLMGGVFIRTEGVHTTPSVQAQEANPSTTVQLELSKNFDEVFEKFDPKVRYNTRLGTKKGVTCGFFDLDHFGDFEKLLTETTSRDGFSGHTVDYYKKMLEFFTEGEARASLAIAYLGDVPLAANIMLDCFGTRVYLHSASSNEHRELKAPHVLQSFVIKDACEKGIKTYDFWGIAPPGSSEKHPWAGLTYFKKSFMGKVVEMRGTWDMPTRPIAYAAYRLARAARKLVY